MQSLPDALAPLSAYKQFLLYKLVWDAVKEKFNKIPISPHTLQTYPKGSDWQKDPASVTDCQTAMGAAALCGDSYGVGFVFTDKDPFFFVDLDKCLEADNATWSPVAMDVMAKLPGAAVEISQSGRGLHIFGMGTAPNHSCKNITLGLEFYTEWRFVALTGTNAVGSAAVDCTAFLGDLVASYFPPKTTVEDQGWTNEPVTSATPPTTDDDLITRALASGGAGNAFGGKAGFKDLWENNVAVLGATYPDDEGRRDYDGSSVDAALAQHLAFWTGNNCERILGLMKRSGLVREKWDRPDYLVRTITRAVSMQTSFYTAGEPERIPVEPVKRIGIMLDGPTRREGWQFLSIDGQINLFKGCVYIQDVHKVFTPGGAMLKSEQFNATYGGYVFQLEDNANGKTTKKAWEAFTESQGVQYPIANSSCFRPILPSGTLIEEEGWVLVNTYAPVMIDHQAGDVEPFLDHIQRLLPVESDRDILVAYMAACVQHKGIKFQWAPLIQGAEGNGKTLLTRCVVAAIGARYTHMPPASEIAEKFNEWLFRKLFIGVEDVYVSEHKKEVIEILKPMITNSRLAMRGMQQSQVMGDNVANFILNSNYKDGVRKTRNDRRFCIFYTAQQSADDMKRDGMTGKYFPNLYKWLESGGYARVANYLSTYEIPDALNPADACHRAPTTSSTEEAVTASMGGVEQEIMEAIEQGRPGFAGGWVSSMAVERLLESQRMTRAIPHNKRRELMQGLGYDWHPALMKSNGRVNNLIPLDGGKPRLFIRDGHIHTNLVGAAEVARQYQEAQGQPVGVAGTSAGEAFR